MVLFKKKEPVPKLPSSPTPAFPSSSLPPLPSLPQEKDFAEKKELPELPSFPSSSKNESLNREMVKSAVSDTSLGTGEEAGIQAPQFPGPKAPVIDNSKFQPQVPEKEAIPSLPKQPAPNTEEIPTHTGLPKLPNPKISEQKPNEPIFVRIDKFQAAQKSFEEIKTRVSEIESVLHKIDEVRKKEEAELKSWTEDAEKLKARLSEIDNDIFSKL